jgi:hypothetical protein
MVEGTDFVSKHHPELFHYTSMDAFKSIYESRQFWATHYAHMNDCSELSLFRLNVTEFIRPIVWNIFNNRGQSDSQFADRMRDARGIDEVVSREASRWLETIHEKTFCECAFMETFVSSFCTHPCNSYEATNGLLSQWRAYGRVAIVFDAKSIEDLMKREKSAFAHPINHIGDVTYDDDSDLRNKPAFRTVFDLFPEILKSPSF